MADQKTAQQNVREQYKVAENFNENALRAWSDLSATTTEYTFEAFEKAVRYNQEALATYRRLYQEGLKSWQNYIQGVSQILTRSN